MAQSKPAKVDSGTEFAVLGEQSSDSVARTPSDFVVCRLGAEVDLRANESKSESLTPEQKEESESFPQDKIYRRFPVRGLDWDGLRSLRVGDHVSFPLPGGGWAEGAVHLVDKRPGEPFGIGGDLISGLSGRFSLVQDPLVGTRGVFLPKEGDYAYRFSEEQGEIFLDEMPQGGVICHGMPKALQSAPFVRRAFASAPIVSYQSRPGASGVLYIDLDGEVVQDPYWGSITAPPAVFSNPESVWRLWQEVSEAYAPFNINVTTDVTVYNAATSGQRMRIIVTPDNSWIGAGGVALLNSFQWAGNTPCWAFNGAANLDSDFHLCAMTISHEFGHTFGLWHDGLLPADPNSNSIGAYYQGHLTLVGGWGPIMGAPFQVDSRYTFPIRPIVQWSAGQYKGTNASSGDVYNLGNNNQNDVGIIAGPLNKVGYVRDDFADTADLAAEIPQNPTNSGFISLTNGLIHADSDVDVFRIDLQQGKFKVEATNGTPVSPNLKIRLTLINPDGVTTNLVSDPLDKLSAAIDTTLPTGTYYLRVEGTGTTTNQQTTDGFVGYGSLGQYKLSGSYPKIPRPPGDNFSDECIALNPPTANFSNTATLFGATAQLGERGFVSGKARTTIWYSWVAPGSGLMNLDTRGSGFDTTLAVCMPAPGKSNTLGNLVLVAANDNANTGTNASALRFSAAAGVPYYFVVDSAKGVVVDGTVKLNGSGNLTSGRPAHDDISSANVLPSLPVWTNSGSLLGATAETNEPSLAGLVATRSVWFRWTSPTNGKLTLHTRGSAVDTVLGLYTGSVTGVNWSNLKLVAANDNISSVNTNSEILAPVTNGAVYFIKVDSRRSAEGNYVLTGTLQPNLVLGAPTGVTFNLKNIKGLNYQPGVAWAPVAGAQGYEVEIMKGTNRVYGVSTTSTNWSNGPVLQITSSPAAVYGARVRAYANSLVSSWSAVVTSTTNK